MTMQVHRLPGEPILIANFVTPFSAADVKTANQATAAFVRELGRPVYRIENTLGVNLDFGDVTAGLQEAARSGDDGSMRDRDVQFVFVGTGPIIEMTAKSFSQTQYAGRDVPLFSTVEQALAYARKAIASGG